MPTSTNKIYLGTNLVSGGAAPVEPDWTAPADWLPLSTMAEGDPTRIEMLVEVLPNDKWHNMVNFNFTGTLTVDWGDGVSESVTNGKVKTYDFDNANLTTLTNGNKMAKIVATGTCTAVKMYTKLAAFTNQVNNKNMHRVLQIRASLPNATAINLSSYMSSTIVGMTHCESIELYTSALLANISYLCSYMTYLQNLVISNVAGVTTALEAFIETYMIKTIPPMIMPNCTNASYMYYKTKASNIGAVQVGNNCNCAYMLHGVDMNSFDLTYGTGCNFSSLHSGTVIKDATFLDMADLSTASSIEGIYWLTRKNTHLDFIPPTTAKALGIVFNIKTIGAINFANITSMSLGGTTLATALVDCDAYNIGFTVSFANQQLSKAVLDKILGNLDPTVVGKTITVTNNPGAATIDVGLKPPNWTLIQ